MTGICGWLGGAARGDAARILVQMSSGVAPGGAAVQTVALESLGLAAIGAQGAWLAQTPEFACAIQGHPTWRDANLAAIALDRGHAAALAEAYRDRAERLLDAVAGPFSLVVLDRQRARVLAAIDRFGVETMCWARADDGALVFGSTTDAVRSHPGVRTAVSVQSLFEYLYFVDRIPAPRTIYDGIAKLAPAEVLTAEAGNARVRRYWQMPYSETTRLSKNEAAEELKRLLRRSIAATVAGEESSKVGTFLSGGLDSSTMTGLAAEIIPGIKSFTIGFPAEGFDESGYAEIASRHFGSEQHTVSLTPEEVLRVVGRCITAYDEPFANSSAVPTFRCAEMAHAAGVDMMIAGDGGDEIFAGNERYVSDGIYDHYAKLPKPLRRMLVEPIVDAPPSQRIPVLAKIGRYSKRGRLPVPLRMIHNIYEHVDPKKIFSADAWGQIDAAATRRFTDEIYDFEGRADKVQRMMNFDLRITLADSDLRKVSRMCALAGVRVRYPFLDEDVAEFSAGLPRGLLLEGGKLRAFYKDAMVGFLPTEILTKAKHGFGLPYFQFITTHRPLRDLVCDTLLQLKSRRFFRPEFLDELVARMRNDTAGPDDAVAWDFFVLEQWLQSRSPASS